MTLSLNEFKQQLVDLSLMSESDISAILSSFEFEQEPQEVEQFARFLVNAKKITPFQLKQLRFGKGKSLVLGNYLILDKIGQGGMGMVLKAEHRRMKRTVALKLLAPTVIESPEAVRRFQREVEAVAKLEHPNIVTAHDADEANGTHFLVMQYVDGEDLAELIKSKGPLSVGAATNYILQAARGLEYSHGRGVVHRDIKPANLLLDRNGTIKILDMGLARVDTLGAQQDQLTGTGQIMGTIDFMAPEQAMNTRDADARADIYSLGITLWYLLTGRVVYKGESSLAKLLAHREQPIPSLQQACPQASPALDRVFTRMIAKSPKARYQSMAELIAVLEQCESQSGSTDSGNAPTAQFGDVQDLTGAGRSNDPIFVATEMALQTAATSPNTAPTVSLELSLRDTLANEQNIPPNSNEHHPILQRYSRLGSLPPIAKWLAMGSGAFLLLLAGIVFFVQTKHGVIRVEINDPDIEVSIKGTDIVLKQADQGKDVTVVPGDRVLTIKRGDFAFETDKLVLKNGPNVTVRVELLADEIKVHQGDKLLGQSKLKTGWRGWPAHVPPPAIAPFNSEQAKQHQEAWAEYLNVPVEYTNSIGMKFRLIPPGEFMMGSTEAEIEDALPITRDPLWRDCIKSEGPQHKVILTDPIYFGAYEVTQSQYEQIMATNPSYYSASGKWREIVEGMDTSNFPVERVSWSNAVDFCRLLIEKEKLNASNNTKQDEMASHIDDAYRLPTEAEWEFACRAGTMTQYCAGNDLAELTQTGWFVDSSSERTHTIGELQCNAFGLYDMHGNVWEWPLDAWDPNWYTTQKNSVNPFNPPAPDSERMTRGGNYSSNALTCRSGSRCSEASSYSETLIGFRVTLTVDAVRTTLKIIRAKTLK